MSGKTLVNGTIYTIGGGSGDKGAVIGSYKGNGNLSRTFAFDFELALFKIHWISSGYLESEIELINGETGLTGQRSGNTAFDRLGTVVWDGKSVTLKANSASSAAYFNDSYNGSTYYYIAIPKSDAT